MRQEELRREIDRAFVRAGMKKSWVYRNYQSMERGGTLAHFRISDIAWFKGAGHILELVNELHTQATPKEDFFRVADMMDIPYHNRMAKKRIAAEVKKDREWRLKFYELERIKKRESREEKLRPLLNYLENEGMQMTEFPIPNPKAPTKFSMQVFDRGANSHTKLYLNVSSDNGSIMIQGDNNFFGLWSDTNDAIHVLTETW